jgi:hypothetical protein
MAGTLHDTTRREFLTAATAAIAGVALAACADEPEGGPGVDCPEVSIQNNHGHVLEIPLADVEAGETKTYSLKGTHEHMLEVDALVFEKIKTDGSHTLSTTPTDGHMHLVEIRLDPECLPAD